MQFHKLPSGIIVDLDSVSRISPPKFYGDKQLCCEYLAGCNRYEAIGADAEALYLAVAALICNREPEMSMRGIVAEDDSAAAPGDDMIATAREMKRRMAVTHSLYEQEDKS